MVKGIVIPEVGRHSIPEAEYLWLTSQSACRDGPDPGPSERRGLKNKDGEFLREDIPV